MGKSTKSQLADLLRNKIMAQVMNQHRFNIW